MPYKILVDVGEAEKERAFVVRPWKNIPIIDENMLDKSIKDADLKVTDRIDRISKPKDQFYYNEIVKTIRRSSVIIVVCIPDSSSGQVAPNVIYELGLAHSLGKPTVIISTSDFSLSDLAGRNIFFIDGLEQNELHARLTTEIKNAREAGKPEWIIDRITYKDIDLVSYNGPDKKADRVRKMLKLSVKIKFTFTKLRQGSIATLMRLIYQLGASNLDRDVQIIVQTLADLNEELSQFQFYHVKALLGDILDYQYALEDVSGSGAMETVQTTANEMKEQLVKFNYECGRLFESIDPIQHKFSDPRAKNEVRDMLSQVLWPLDEIARRIVSNCDFVMRLCVESI